MAPRTRKDEAKAPELSDDDRIVIEAQDRFKRCQDWEAEFQTLYKDDVKFANGDSDNGWQWPRDLKKEREKNKRPALTINKTAGYVNLIVNDARQNKPSVSIKPTGDETSFKAAQIYEGLIRHIEYVSKAQTVYDESMQSAVEGGIGWWRVVSEYEGDDSFDQDIKIKPVRNQLSVYLDPDIEQLDGSDAMFGFVFNDLPRDEAMRQNPDVDFSVGPISNSLNGPDTWVKPDNVRIAEYYRIHLIKDQLVYMEDDEKNSATFLRSDVPAKFRKQIDEAEKNGQEFKKRDVNRRELQWFKIVGDAIVARRKLKFKYIPLVRTVGIERIIDGKLVRRGHVRNLKDPQRMYNYNTSAQVEYGATGTKSPWVGPKKAFEGNEDSWNRANVQNAAYLTYNHWDAETEQPIPKPERMDPPGLAPAFIDGMKIADHEMDMASGQYAPQQGQPSNEKSGKAIAERQRQGDTTNYHFIDHQAIAVRYTGMIILDMVPHIYDTERVLQIRGKDGTQSKIRIKPDQQTALQQEKIKVAAQDSQDEAQTVEIMFNPKIGKYMVEADIGPAYSTQRQEAWNAFVQIVTGAPQLIDEIGDLMFYSADFPLADKIAERLMRKIRVEKPYLFDEQAPTPAMQQMQEQVKEMSTQVAELMQKLAEYRLKLTGKEQMRDIDAYDAESKRITALSNAQPELNRTGDVPELSTLIKQTLAQMLGLDITKVVDEEQGGDQEQNGQPIDIPDMGLGGGEQPSMNGARQAPDGNFYMRHPDTGQHMRLEPQFPPHEARDDGFHPSHIGAKKAPDGHWYVPHHGKPGKYLRVKH